MQSSTGRRTKWNRGAFVLFLSLASCIFETRENPGKGGRTDGGGYLDLDLLLKPNNRALFK